MARVQYLMSWKFSSVMPSVNLPVVIVYLVPKTINLSSLLVLQLKYTYFNTYDFIFICCYMFHGLFPKYQGTTLFPQVWRLSSAHFRSVILYTQLNTEVVKEGSSQGYVLIFLLKQKCLTVGDTISKHLMCKN